jgi:arsenite methyltransferase
MTTHRLQVFDPPMCCSTGVCGPEPDPALAQFSADLRWAEGRGVPVERFSLSREPEAFVSTPAVADAFRRLSVAALPLVLVDGRVVSEGAYPSRAVLAASLELATDETAASRFRIATEPGCVPGSGCCG